MKNKRVGGLKISFEDLFQIAMGLEIASYPYQTKLVEESWPDIILSCLFKHLQNYPENSCIGTQSNQE